MSDSLGTDEVVTPLVVCATQGGPYDDESFLAGCYFEEWWKRLSIGDPEIAAGLVPTGLVPQLDLLAMAHGFDFEAEDKEDGWSFVIFTRAFGDEDGVPEI